MATALPPLGPTPHGTAQQPALWHGPHPPCQVATHPGRSLHPTDRLVQLFDERIGPRAYQGMVRWGFTGHPSGTWSASITILDQEDQDEIWQEPRPACAPITLSWGEQVVGKHGMEFVFLR